MSDGSGAPPPPLPPAPPPPPPLSGSRLKQYWDGGVTFAHDVGEWAKLGALLLAIAGLVGVLVPDAKRWWEIHLGSEAWYYIGVVKNGRFEPFSYQHPFWNSGPVPAAVLDKLPGRVIVTLKGDVHIGRAKAGADGEVQSIVPDGACLNVRELARRSEPAKPEQYIWAGAVKVSC